MRHDRTVIGYHGCDADVADRLLSGEPFTPSANDFDWLGHGIYFWEYGADRALRFALEQKARGTVKNPTVVGAVIQLGRCFDLLDTHFTHDLAVAYPAWEAQMHEAGAKIPVNVGAAPDHKLRRLDCAVLNWFLDLAATKAGIVYDTIRGGFTEGMPVFKGSGIRMETHIQLAVRNPECILGVFRPTQRGRP